MAFIKRKKKTVMQSNGLQHCQNVFKSRTDYNTENCDLFFFMSIQWLHEREWNFKIIRAKKVHWYFVMNTTIVPAGAETDQIIEGSLWATIQNFREIEQCLVVEELGELKVFFLQWRQPHTSVWSDDTLEVSLKNIQRTNRYNFRKNLIIFEYTCIFIFIRMFLFIYFNTITFIGPSKTFLLEQSLKPGINHGKIHKNWNNSLPSSPFPLTFWVQVLSSLKSQKNYFKSNYEVFI